MRAKLGTAQAITATAHKIARILYHVLSTKEPYAESVFHHCDEQARQRAALRLRKQAARLGFQLLSHPSNRKMTVSSSGANFWTTSVRICTRQSRPVCSCHFFFHAAAFSGLPHESIHLHDPCAGKIEVIAVPGPDFGPFARSSPGSRAQRFCFAVFLLLFLLENFAVERIRIMS